MEVNYDNEVLYTHSIITTRELKWLIPINEIITDFALLYYNEKKVRIKNVTLKQYDIDDVSHINKNIRIYIPITIIFYFRSINWKILPSGTFLYFLLPLIFEKFSF